VQIRNAQSPQKSGKTDVGKTDVDSKRGLQIDPKTQKSSDGSQKSGKATDLEKETGISASTPVTAVSENNQALDKQALNIALEKINALLHRVYSEKVMGLEDTYCPFIKQDTDRLEQSVRYSTRFYRWQKVVAAHYMGISAEFLDFKGEKLCYEVALFHRVVQGEEFGSGIIASSIASSSIQDSTPIQDSASIQETTYSSEKITSDSWLTDGLIMECGGDSERVSGSDSGTVSDGLSSGFDHKLTDSQNTNETVAKTEHSLCPSDLESLSVADLSLANTGGRCAFKSNATSKELQASTKEIQTRRTQNKKRSPKKKTSHKKSDLLETASLDDILKAIFSPELLLDEKSFFSMNSRALPSLRSIHEAMSHFRYRIKQLVPLFLSQHRVEIQRGRDIPQNSDGEEEETRIQHSKKKDFNPHLRVFVWAENLVPGGGYRPHNHVGSLVSGQYFIGNNTRKSSLMFTDPRGLNPPFGANHFVSPQMGELHFWSGWMQHAHHWKPGELRSHVDSTEFDRSNNQDDKQNDRSNNQDDSRNPLVLRSFHFLIYEAVDHRDWEQDATSKSVFPKKTGFTVG